ncbi:flocculation protein FLO11-like [Stegodyphus dumicola]|uniref:flocculation protein FLO11-like n=1 Tax=Stegodyphus dumicola TaxID=202533 RepID=UPI0015AF0709|nr:flocculation protein FLO11-like [Stegodyphus dumicola]
MNCLPISIITHIPPSVSYPCPAEAPLVTSSTTGSSFAAAPSSAVLHAPVSATTTPTPGGPRCSSCGKVCLSKRHLRFHRYRRHRRSSLSASPGADAFVTPGPSPSGSPTLPASPYSPSAPSGPPPGPLGPSSTCRIDNTLHLVFPVSDVFICTEPNCSLLFRSGSWSRMKKSLTRHILQEHLIHISSCMKWCGLCSSILANRVSSHSCFRTTPPVSSSGASFQWKCSVCYFSCPSRKGLFNHSAFHQRASRNAAANNIPLPLPVAQRRRRRRPAPPDSSPTAAASVRSHVPAPAVAPSPPSPTHAVNPTDSPLVSTPTASPLPDVPASPSRSTASPLDSPSSSHPSLPLSPLDVPSSAVTDPPVLPDDASALDVSTLPSDELFRLPSVDDVSSDPPLLLHRDSLQCFASGPTDDSSWCSFESCPPPKGHASPHF